MPLVIFNNGATFDRQLAHSRFAHLGTRDRDNPGNRSDFPGKADRLLEAAIEPLPPGTPYFSRVGGVVDIAGWL